ncbi:MAG: hypothetical protein ACREX0_17745, partial [Noviherbaspirillum sp.]
MLDTLIAQPTAPAAVTLDARHPLFKKLVPKLGGAALAVAAALTIAAPATAQTVLLNVSYDVARELFKDINPVFIADWKKNTGETITINQSHGGSSKQARAVAD